MNSPSLPVEWGIFISPFFFSAFLLLFRRLPSSFPPDVIRHLRRPLCRLPSFSLFLLSAGFLLLFRRMSSGIFCVHCAACYAACFVSIVRDIIPLRPIPPTPVGLTLGATPPSSFLPFSFLPFSFLSSFSFLRYLDISYIVISEYSLSCPPRFVLCAPLPLARFPFSPSFYLRFSCSFFVLCAPAPLCPVLASSASGPLSSFCGLAA